MRVVHQRHVSSFSRSFPLSLVLLGSSIVPLACDKDGEEGGESSSSTPASEAGEDSGSASQASADTQASECGDMSSTIYGSDCQDYVDCAQANCGPAYEECLGPAFESGDFSGGACETYMECVVACDCDDDDCRMGCYNDHFMGECMSCLTNDVGLCVATNCTTELAACSE